MNNRDFRIDFMRVFACIMVLFCHAPQPYINQPGQFMMGINNYFGMAWGPILFFAISGACILDKEHEAIPFLKKRFARILIPTIVWSVIYIFTEAFWWHTSSTGGVFTKLPMILLTPQYGLMWFMYALIAIYLGIVANYPK